MNHDERLHDLRYAVKDLAEESRNIDHINRNYIKKHSNDPGTPIFDRLAEEMDAKELLNLNRFRESQNSVEDRLNNIRRVIKRDQFWD